MTADQVNLLARLNAAVDKVSTRIQDLVSEAQKQAQTIADLTAKVDALTAQVAAATPDPAIDAALAADADKLEALSAPPAVPTPEQ